MIEGQRVVSWIWDQLAADTGAGGVFTLLGGRLYRDLVPQAAALPAATVTLVSATDTNTMRGTRVFANTLVDVRIVGDGANYAAITPIADRVDAVLQSAAGSKSGAAINKLRREQVTAFTENDAGKVYAHIVSSYRSEAYAT